MNEEGAPLRDDTVAQLAMFAGSPSASVTSFGMMGGPPSSRPNHLPTSSLRRIGRPSGPGDRIREMEKRLYVFDREHLEVDLELVAQSLLITDEQLLTEPALLCTFILLAYQRLIAHAFNICSPRSPHFPRRPLAAQSFLPPRHPHFNLPSTIVSLSRTIEFESSHDRNFDIPHEFLRKDRTEFDEMDRVAGRS